MSIKTKLAKRKLNNKEQKHLTESGVNSINQLISSRAKQVVWLKENLDKGMNIGSAEPCWECRAIVEKLDLIKDHPELDPNV